MPGIEPKISGVTEPAGNFQSCPSPLMLTKVSPALSIVSPSGFWPACSENETTIWTLAAAAVEADSSTRSGVKAARARTEMRGRLGEAGAITGGLLPLLEGNCPNLSQKVGKAGG